MLQSDMATNVWQPIETAPKDGTWVLIYAPEAGLRNPVSIRQWRDWQRGSGAVEPHWVDEWSQVRPSLTPTHWLPLPAPPTLASCTSSDAIQTGRSASPENEAGG